MSDYATISAETNRGIEVVEGGVDPNETVKVGINKSNIAAGGTSTKMLGFEAADNYPRLYDPPSGGTVTISITAGENITAGDPIAEGGYVADSGNGSKANVIGIATTTATTGNPVTVQVAGEVSDLDTSSCTLGQLVYLNASVYDGTYPAQTTFIIMGVCTEVHATTGKIALNINVMPSDGSNNIIIGGMDSQSYSIVLGDNSGSYAFRVLDNGEVEVAHIDSDGLIQSPATYSNDVSGGTYVPAQIDDNGNFGYDSSARFVNGRLNKKDEATITKTEREQLLTLPVKTYLKDGKQQREAGFVAEDIVTVMPDIVALKDGQPHTVVKERLIPHLVAMIQDLTARVEELEK